MKQKGFAKARKGGQEVYITDFTHIPDLKRKQLLKAGIETVEQLASTQPRKYYDFRKITRMSEIQGDTDGPVAIVGKIQGFRSGPKYVTAIVDDGSGTLLNVTWFHQPYIERTLYLYVPYIFCGKISYSPTFNNFSMAAPVFYSCHKSDFGRIIPVYRKIPGMSVEYFRDTVKLAASMLIADPDFEDSLDADIRSALEIPEIKEYFRMLHAPMSDTDLEKATQRNIADKLFPFALKMAWRAKGLSDTTPYRMQSFQKTVQFMESLPFSMTKDQRQAVETILAGLKSGKRLDALVQGDVGCGKTVVAVAACVAAAENGYQSVIMAPTTVLAEQHYRKFSEDLQGSNIKTVYLASGMKAAERRNVLKQIENGEAQVIVGTHAVISESVVFKNLALAVIDEEHRFGVKQRTAFREKTGTGVHSISMTATPIPRTLANAFYGGDTKVINIHTMPAGRKPVQTVVFGNEEKVYEAMYRQIQAGHQCYVVCPLIDDSDSDALAEVESANQTAKKMKDWFAQYPEVHIAKVTGDLEKNTIQKRIEEFAAGKAQILISTTIVEVGVNVPNATVMVIKNAERFGLAQLHQLRGRVGRGDAQSFCVLLSKDRNNPRLRTMVATNDGFEIAQEDMALRGTGNLVGIEQHGFDQCVTLMLQHPDMYAKCVEQAKVLIGSDKIQGATYQQMLVDSADI